MSAMILLTRSAARELTGARTRFIWPAREGREMNVNGKPNIAVTVGGGLFGKHQLLALRAGPCQLESRAHALEMAVALKEIATLVGIGLVFKTSFDKTNRTNARTARGVGLE